MPSTSKTPESPRRLRPRRQEQPDTRTLQRQLLTANLKIENLEKARKEKEEKSIEEKLMSEEIHKDNLKLQKIQFNADFKPFVDESVAILMNYKKVGVKLANSVTKCNQKFAEIEKRVTEVLENFPVDDKDEIKERVDKLKGAVEEAEKDVNLVRGICKSMEMVTMSESLPTCHKCQEDVPVKTTSERTPESQPSTSKSPVCQICFFDFANDRHRTPRVLACGHSLCTECAERILDGFKIVCPFDRKESLVPMNRVSLMSKNFSLLQMFDKNGE